MSGAFQGVGPAAPTAARGVPTAQQAAAKGLGELNDGINKAGTEGLTLPGENKSRALLERILPDNLPNPTPVAPKDKPDVPLY